MATYSSNTTLKYSAAASSGGVVPANSFAICTYTCTSIPGGSGAVATAFVFRTFAAGVTVPATFTAVVYRDSGGVQHSATYTFASGVILANSP